MLRAGLLALAASGCAHPKDESAPSEYARSAELAAAHEDALHQLPEGWPAGTDCDGLLWAGLSRAAGHPVDLLAARDSEGLWHRRQVLDGECYPDGAGSTISRDMFVGLLAGLVEAKDLETVKATLAYAREHEGRMGEPWPGDGRTQWTPNVYGLWERAAGEKSDTPIAFLPTQQDYETNLQLVEIATYARITGGALPVHVRGWALQLAAQNPTDGLAQAVACVAGYEQPCELADRLLRDPGYVCPSYVRGPEKACAIHRAYGAQVLSYPRKAKAE